MAGLLETPSFIRRILRPIWKEAAPEKVQFHGGWFAKSRARSEVEGEAAAAADCWPGLSGSNSGTPIYQAGSGTFAQVVMAGRGEVGPRQGGFHGGKGNWNAGKDVGGEWLVWRGPNQQGGPPGGIGGQFTPGFGYSGQHQFVPQDQRPQFFSHEQRPQFAPQDQRPPGSGNFNGNDFYNYGGGYYGNPAYSGGANVSTEFPGNGIRAQGNAASGGQAGSVAANVSGNKVQTGQSSGGVGTGKLPAQTSAARPGMGACYKCGLVGHGIKECKTAVLCDVCGKESHITGNCVLPNQPKPAAVLIGCGGDGLQMFSAQTGKKVDPSKAKQAIALVKVHSGKISAQQLVDGLGRMFPCAGWEWKASPHLNKSFLVKFPSVQKIEELQGFEYIGIPGVQAAVKVSKWNNASMAKYKLYTVWVRLTGIPDSLMHYHGFCEAGSLIGKVREVDMRSYRQHEIVRVKVGVKDPRKIPEFAELNEDDMIYDIWFELEDIVEQGGPMRGGVLVINSEPSPTPGQNQKQSEAKRYRETGAAGESGSSKSPRTNDEVDAVNGGNEVMSSQYAMEKVLREELEEKKRKVLLEQQKADDVVTEKVVEDAGDDSENDASMAEKVDIVGDISDDEDEDGLFEDPEEFARKVGLSTQRIQEISDSVDEEMNKENAAPVDSNTSAGSASSMAVNSEGLGVEKEVNQEEAKKQALLEAQERIRKAKAKAELDDAVRRRSSRNRKNDETHSMDKCEDMAKKRNLETNNEKRAAKSASAGS